MVGEIKPQGPYSQNFFTQIRQIFLTLTCILELIPHQYFSTYNVGNINL